ncbi:MAG: chlorite dismutase family protein, partial [Chloroflexi bacterium]|nr:chlorite dismutase family protein [Chloroflexota bacterium]
MTLNITIPQPDDTIDVSEKGQDQAGETISLDRRLFVQLLVFTGCHDMAPLVSALETAAIQGALYLDVNDPYGLGLLAFSAEPDYFVTTVRDLVNREPFLSLTPRPEFTMLGRTYAIGYEHDLEQTLITRPINRITNPEWPWVIWYPLRRSGAFEQLPADEQRTVLMEHGGIGRAYGRVDYGHDVRLACHGLGKTD